MPASGPGKREWMPASFCPKAWPFDGFAMENRLFRNGKNRELSNHDAKIGGYAVGVEENCAV